MQTKAIPLALAATFACGVALAQTTTPPSTTSPSSTPGSSTSDTGSSHSTSSSSTTGIGGDYTKMDKDKDGTLSRKEAASNKDLTKQWSTLDVNKDGKLDEAEFSQFETESMSMDPDSSTGSDGMRTDDKPKY